MIDDSSPAPILCPPERVLEDWIDYNGHLNMAYYNVIFDRGVDHFFDLLNIGADYAASGAGSCFTLEVHLHYIQELKLDDAIEVRLQLLDFDHKRLHFFQEMYHCEQGYLAATSEQIALHVDMKSRRSAPFPASVQAQLDALFSAHKKLPKSERIGHVIGIEKGR